MTAADKSLVESVAMALWGADENAHEQGWSDVNPRWRDHYTRMAQCAVAVVLAEVVAGGISVSVGRDEQP